MRKQVWFLICLLSSQFSWAQTVDVQGWYECMVNYPFGKRYNIENSLTYSSTVNSQLWRAFDYSVCLERSVTPHFDLLAQSVFSYTNQTNRFNTFEVRPVIGGRLHLTPNTRI